MSSILDLAGGTHTIASDTTETYWYITDTSSGHNGTLILNSGAHLKFDDAPNAGFSSVASAITIIINGNSEAPCYIESVEDVPHYPWKLPATTCSLTATRCKFRYCEGDHSPNWILNAGVEWGGDAMYCTVTDVRNLTGVPVSGTMGISDARIAMFIRNASDEIETRTGRKWMPTVVVNEEYDWDGKPLLALRHFPVLSISSVEYRTGDTTWETMTKGPTSGDYWYSADDLLRGQIRIIVPPPYSLQSMRLTYTYGYDPIPHKIRKLCTYMASIDVYKASQGVGSQNIYQKDIDYLNEEVRRLMESFGTELDVYIAPFDQRTTRYGASFVQRARLWQ